MVTRKKMVAGNWKMNGRLDTVEPLLRDLKTELNAINFATRNVECVVFPPAIFIPTTQASLEGSGIAWGGQNVYPALQGAYTGEHSVLMYSDFGCRYMLVGHSERRQLFGEGEKFIAEKFHLIKEHDMIPLLCVGETLEERSQGRTQAVLQSQLCALLERDSRCFRDAVIAYEPVWAIGTGKTATPVEVQEVHLFIREQIRAYSPEDAGRVTVLYGGSVNEKNAQALFAMPDVDGGLVGGASLNAKQFVEIVKCIN
jgi:triosephosphate isomerase